MPRDPAANNPSRLPRCWQPTQIASGSRSAGAAAWCAAVLAGRVRAADQNLHSGGRYLWRDSTVSACSQVPPAPRRLLAVRMRSQMRLRKELDIYRNSLAQTLTNEPGASMVTSQACDQHWSGVRGQGSASARGPCRNTGQTPPQTAQEATVTSCGVEGLLQEARRPELHRRDGRHAACVDLRATRRPHSPVPSWLQAPLPPLSAVSVLSVRPGRTTSKTPPERFHAGAAGHAQDLRLMPDRMFVH